MMISYLCDENIFFGYNVLVCFVFYELALLFYESNDDDMMQRLILSKHCMHINIVLSCNRLMQFVV